MKKLLIMSIPLLVVLMAFRKNDLTKSGIPNRIDLESKLTQPSAVVIESGCTATYFSTIEIKYPVNPTPHAPSASFKIKVTAEQKELFFNLSKINDAFVRNSPPTNITREFTLTSGQSLRLTLKFQVTNKDMDFNRAVLIKATIKPRERIIRGRLVADFDDSNTDNDMLSQLIVIGSSNSICYKCIETENYPEHVMHSFFIPLIDPCQKSPAFLSNTSTSAELKQAETPLTTFEFVKNGVIANTSIKTVLIKNNLGKFLTFFNDIPVFMDRINNDLHNQQDWVILKTTEDGCNDKRYKLVQYLDGNTCKELIQKRLSINFTRFFLSYRNGISEGSISEKIIIAPFGPTVFPNPN